MHPRTFCLLIHDMPLHDDIWTIHIEKTFRFINHHIQDCPCHHINVLPNLIAHLLIMHFIMLMLQIVVLQLLQKKIGLLPDVWIKDRHQTYTLSNLSGQSHRKDFIMAGMWNINICIHLKEYIVFHESGFGRSISIHVWMKNRAKGFYIFVFPTPLKFLLTRVK